MDSSIYFVQILPMEKTNHVQINFTQLWCVLYVQYFIKLKGGFVIVYVRVTEKIIIYSKNNLIELVTNWINDLKCCT